MKVAIILADPTPYSKLIWEDDNVLWSIFTCVDALYNVSQCYTLVLQLSVIHSFCNRGNRQPPSAPARECVCVAEWLLGARI